MKQANASATSKSKRFRGVVFLQIASRNRDRIAPINRARSIDRKRENLNAAQYDRAFRTFWARLVLFGHEKGNRLIAFLNIRIG